MTDLERLPSGNYRYQGREIPGLTRTLGILAPYRRVPRGVLSEAQRRGQAAHLAIHLLEGGGDGSGLHWDSVHSSVVPYAHAWEKFKAETRWKTLGSEVPVASSVYQFGCTPDLYGTLKGIPSVIDCKCGLAPLVGLQLAAQAQAAKECWKGNKPRRYSLSLKPTGNYRLHEWKDAADWATFLAVLQVAQWLQRYAPAVLPEEIEPDFSNFEDYEGGQDEPSR